MKPVAYHPEAEEELDAAVDIYEAQRQGRGVKFRQAVVRAESDIQSAPKASPKYKRTRCREYIVRRFPYAIYSVEHRRSIEVIAVAHGRRKPGYWHRRLK
jgi:toxin ParE1/3/4